MSSSVAIHEVSAHQKEGRRGDAKRLASSMWMQLISLGVVTTEALYIHTYVFINVSRPRCLQGTSRGQSFQPLNCGGLRRSEDTEMCFCALMAEKCRICFPLAKCLGICCYLKRVFHTMVKPRYFCGCVASSALISARFSGTRVARQEAAARRGPVCVSQLLCFSSCRKKGVMAKVCDSSPV